MILGLQERLLRRGDYLRGAFVKPERVDGYIVGVNPGDREDILGRFGFSEASVDEAVRSARRGSALWRRVDASERATALRRFRDAMSNMSDRLAMLICRETGKPLWEARQEVVASIRVVDLLVDDGLPLLSPAVLHETDARSDYRPQGVVAVIVPFSLPLLHATLNVQAAILTGNAVVLKPSKFTPGVGQAVAELMDRCRLPRGVFNLVQGSGAGVGSRLVEHPGVDALLFSGSHATAEAISSTLRKRPHLPRMLHTGGKASATILPGCEMDQAIYETILGAFLTSGQRHNSTARVFVLRSIADVVCDALARRMQHVRVGYGLDSQVFMGPVISENVRSRYRRFGKKLSAEGHTALLGVDSFEPGERRGFYVRPSLYLMDGNDPEAWLGEESPGPILMVHPVDSWEEAISRHNQVRFRPAASIFGDPDSMEVEEMSQRIQSGAININRSTIGASQRLPSAGFGSSSNGYSSGIQLLRFLTRPSAMLVERRPFDREHLVPGVYWDAGPRAEDVTSTYDPDADATDAD